MLSLSAPIAALDLGLTAVIPPVPEPEVEPGRIDDWSNDPQEWLRVKRPVVPAVAYAPGVTVTVTVGEVWATGEANAEAEGVAATLTLGQPAAKGIQNLPDDILIAMLLEL